MIGKGQCAFGSGRTEEGLAGGQPPSSSSQVLWGKVGLKRVRGGRGNRKHSLRVRPPGPQRPCPLSVLSTDLAGTLWPWPHGFFMDQMHSSVL